MCRTSWFHAILTNSAWSSSWPAGWVQPLCEVSTWPIASSLQETGNRCSFRKCSLLHQPSLGRWVASLKMHKEGQKSPWGLSAPLAGSHRCCHGPATTPLCAQLHALASPSYSFVWFCIHENLISLLQTEQSLLSYGQSKMERFSCSLLTDCIISMLKIIFISLWKVFLLDISCITLFWVLPV